MFNLEAISTGNLIDIAGVVLTLSAIIISVRQFAKSVNNSILEAKKQMAIEQTSALPLQVTQFCSCASDVAVGIVMGLNYLDENLKSEYMESRQKQDKLLPEIKERIFAYGSRDAIKIFMRFESIILNPINNEFSIDAYYLLPLLITQVKMDVTGEKINPLWFFNSLMPQFEKHNDKAKEYINKAIDDMKLDSKVKIV